MKITCHVIVNSNGSARMTVRKPELRADEIAIQLNLDVPDAYFERPYPVIAAKLPTPRDGGDPDLAIELSSPVIAEALGVDAGDVRDGLAGAYAKAKAAKDGG